MSVLKSVPKKLFVKTWGCQMNVYDSERMADAMGASGYETTDRADEADMILLNTCHIREKASEKMYSELGRLKEHKIARPDVKIGVAGCVAQAEGEEIIRRQPMVDVVVGPQAYHRLPDMVARSGNGTKVVDTEFPEEDKFTRLPRGPKARRAPAAFLTVQEGCDKFCAFCVVPYTRGAEVSRPVDRIIAEARDLVERGVVELTLLGQNVNAYHGVGAHGEAATLAQLLRELAKIEGLERLRYTTSHPNDMGDDLIAVHAELEKVMPYLHLPVQSGSDKILKAMNRRHTAESYLKLIERIRAARPDIALSGDFIVGFPGETDADFADTMALVEAVGYGSAFSFKYSARPGTPAAGRALVDDDVAHARLLTLQAKITEDQFAFQTSMIGRTLPILVEKVGRNAGQVIGKSPYLHAVHFEAPADSVGKILQAEIIASERNSLTGHAV